MELYIARDKCGGLYLYNDEPIKDNNFGVFQADNAYSEIEINLELHPEVTWENSPQRVELKLIKNDSNS